MSFKCTISVSCLSNHCDNKFTRWLAHSPLLWIFTCEKSTDRNWVWSALLTCSHRKGWTLEKSLVTLKYGFTSMTRRNYPTPVCADIRPWHLNRWSIISMTMLRVRSKFFRQNTTKLHTHHHVGSSDQSEFISGGLVSIYLVYGKVAAVIHAVFASSRGIRQSKLPTQHVRPESGRWFPLV